MLSFSYIQLSSSPKKGRKAGKKELETFISFEAKQVWHGAERLGTNHARPEVQFRKQMLFQTYCRPHMES